MSNLESITPTTAWLASTSYIWEDLATFENLTLYEKKAFLANRELDSMGMDYMLDLLWAQAFELVATPLKQELGFSDPGLEISSALLREA
jgi:hypothetical protein